MNSDENEKCDFEKDSSKLVSRQFMASYGKWQKLQICLKQAQRGRIIQVEDENIMQ